MMGKGYYDALIFWCEHMCERTYRLESPDGSIHCYFRGQQVDLQDIPNKRPCHKCPYNRDDLWQAKSRKDMEVMIENKSDFDIDMRCAYRPCLGVI